MFLFRLKIKILMSGLINGSSTNSLLEYVAEASSDAACDRITDITTELNLISKIQEKGERDHKLKKELREKLENAESKINILHSMVKDHSSSSTFDIESSPATSTTNTNYSTTLFSTTNNSIFSESTNNNNSSCSSKKHVSRRGNMMKVLHNDSLSNVSSDSLSKSHGNSNSSNTTHCFTENCVSSTPELSVKFAKSNSSGTTLGLSTTTTNSALSVCTDTSTDTNNNSNNTTTDLSCCLTPTSSTTQLSGTSQTTNVLSSTIPSTTSHSTSVSTTTQSSNYSQSSNMYSSLSTKTDPLMSLNNSYQSSTMPCMNHSVILNKVEPSLYVPNHSHSLEIRTKSSRFKRPGVVHKVTLVPCTSSSTIPSVNTLDTLSSPLDSTQSTTSTTTTTCKSSTSLSSTFPVSSSTVTSTNTTSLSPSVGEMRHIPEDLSKVTNNLSNMNLTNNSNTGSPLPNSSYDTQDSTTNHNQSQSSTCTTPCVSSYVNCPNICTHDSTSTPLSSSEHKSSLVSTKSRSIDDSSDPSNSEKISCSSPTSTSTNTSSQSPSEHIASSSSSSPICTCKKHAESSPRLKLVTSAPNATSTPNRCDENNHSFNSGSNIISTGSPSRNKYTPRKGIVKCSPPKSKLEQHLDPALRGRFTDAYINKLTDKQVEEALEKNNFSTKDCHDNFVHKEFKADFDRKYYTTNNKLHLKNRSKGRKHEEKVSSDDTSSMVDYCSTYSYSSCSVSATSPTDSTSPDTNDSYPSDRRCHCHRIKKYKKKHIPVYDYKNDKDVGELLIKRRAQKASSSKPLCNCQNMRHSSHDKCFSDIVRTARQLLSHTSPEFCCCRCSSSEVLDDLERYASMKFGEMDEIIHKLQEGFHRSPRELEKENHRLRKHLRNTKRQLTECNHNLHLACLDRCINNHHCKCQIRKECHYPCYKPHPLLDDGSLVLHIADEFNQYLRTEEPISRETAHKLIDRAGCALRFR